MTKKIHRNQAGFTLIELLTVIAIIGILAAIVIPSVGAVRETAQRAADASNLGQIGKAALIYGTDNNDKLPHPDDTTRPITSGTKYQQWFGQLAKFGGLDEPKIFVSNIDDALTGFTIPNRALDPDNTTPTLLPAFVALPTLSFNVVGGLKQSDPSTTPLAFTRGLKKADGKWNGVAASDDSPQRAVYKDKGGHIVFLGGNVQYFSGGINNGLTSNKGKATSVINQAVPNRSTVKFYGVDNSNNVASATGTAAEAGN